MNDWYNSAVLAGKPGMPARTHHVSRLAVQNGWRQATSDDGAPLARKGLKGSWLYHISLLPRATQIALVSDRLAEPELPFDVARDAATAQNVDRLNGSATNQRDARLILLQQANRFKIDSGLSVKAADDRFCRLYNVGQIDVSDWVKTVVKSCSPATLARWRRLKRDGEITKLGVDRSAARKGTSVLDRAERGAVRTYVLALIAKQPHFTATHVRKACLGEFGDRITIGERQVDMPPLRTFQAALKRWKTDFRNELILLTDPDRYKGAVRFVARNTAAQVTRLNEVWQIDASPADVLTRDGRRNLYAAIDIYSRRIVAMESATPRAQAVGLLLRKAILKWGVPEEIKTDNGSDFIARDTQRLLAALDIHHDPSAPFSPEQKGHVERVIGTIQRGLMRTLPGFVGHSVADRKVIESRKAFSKRLGADDDSLFGVELSPTELQSFIDRWCEAAYEHAPHSGLNGKTPFEVAAGYTGKSGGSTTNGRWTCCWRRWLARTASVPSPNPAFALMALTI